MPATAMDSALVAHWIDGKEQAGFSGRTAPVYDPALGTVSTHVSLVNLAGIVAAIASATAAFPARRDQSIAKRQQILFSLRELLNAREGEMAEIITSERGKVLSDALGEVSRGQEVVEFSCGIPHLLKVDYSENDLIGVDMYSTRQAPGVVAVIIPFNFPATVPKWFFPLALAAASTSVSPKMAHAIRSAER
ncbi:acyl-CoA reductase-like NAD-dependent aldehyde dehydrogenase [Cryobacterium sp. CAN_C3]|uniref:aldehyde dehydrogenase family protein n=1 Tax=unclassified Cryobacterium TaxID=2649013 RepID=UPI001A1B4C75|nr:acyl-CoA reductase-like NAD-dependent aldehyde dehydrogenase [Cryobacterium sp. CAN_C3]